MSSPFYCSRRKFCAAAGVGLAGLALPACDAGDSRLSVGGLDTKAGGPGIIGGGSTDMAGQQQGGNPDLAMQQGGNPDMAHQQGGTCNGTIMCGSASAIGVNQSKYFSGIGYKVYLCRDSGGLFSVDAHCTHENQKISQQGQGWFCPAHGATFAFDGTQPTAPAFSPLGNYAVCVDGNGNAVIDLNTQVSPTTRV